MSFTQAQERTLLKAAHKTLKEHALFIIVNFVYDDLDLTQRELIEYVVEELHQFIPKTHKKLRHQIREQVNDCYNELFNLLVHNFECWCCWD